jgi:hypothetical protein
MRLSFFLFGCLLSALLDLCFELKKKIAVFYAFDANSSSEPKIKEYSACVFHWKINNLQKDN